VPRVAPRLVWAVETLAARPGDHLLEIGCGNGLAAELLLASRPEISLAAIDRSATAIAACKRRLAPFIEEGRAEAFHTEIAKFSSRTKFDRAFAINVNSFWLDAAADLEALARVLAPGGALLLVFEPPSASKIERIAEACSTQLREQGFSRVATSRHRAIVAVRAVRRR
jgi:cyclopropane fatty-acyl-phospholipid synthase-like methyltransferase